MDSDLKKFAAMAVAHRNAPRPDGFEFAGMDHLLFALACDWPVAADQNVTYPFACFPNMCFDNAFRLAKREPKTYRYVEGYAMGVIPVHHAWCLNQNDEVIDPTWDRYGTIGSSYFGVVIPLAVARSIRHRKNHSMLLNWERNYPLLREPWRLTNGEAFDCGFRGRAQEAGRSREEGARGHDAEARDRSRAVG